jgi:cyclophilin family peptidyl-prolyl cis-trans isomerase
MRRIFLILSVFLVTGCSHAIFKERWLKTKSPETFSVRFETSKGSFEAEFTRQWSPKAVDRLYVQFKHGYYNHTLFYRVRPGYVVQFGGDDHIKEKQWGRIKVPDEPVLQPNTRGAISFARSTKDSRGNDLFINLANNSPRLDTITYNGVTGFPVLGKVTKGMETVDALYNGYSDRVFQLYDTLISNKQKFLESFPKLDSIKKVVLIRTKS